ncbi:MULTISPECIES: hypothetical protein [Okeania]|uniref:Uncharacterized protein n=1 Tax=Okeania hirsuta TaxID=1458930 RepID=A0A3N6P9C7_9CYAN|nr:MULTISPECIES: hypothetical protein [Okeania]NES77079.1 hypothetical protein [Okeania sp. SIO1H4]NES90517.1 hypothetical protein [Okeania sp. SIO2B9]NET21394.1 hypothetical protein [Okeania sp. SIO1H5]NET77222.1 hypothetical protein [Okeania sp. SIO1F9]NET93942.1 hypothetical protein [Okeania sp. SIO1H2]
MKLNNDYQRNRQELPTINMMMGEAVEEYRGQHRDQGWTYPYVKHIPIPQHPSKKLFCARDDELAKEKQTINVAQIVKEKQVEPKKIAQVNRTNICDILQWQRSIAKIKGDERLLSLLEIEWRDKSCG